MKHAATRFDAKLDHTNTAAFLASLRAVEAMRADVPAGMQSVIFEHLLRHPGCSLRSILDAMYPDPESEPMTSNWVFKVMLSRLRNNIAPHGYTVDGNTRSKGRYWLRRLA